MSHHFPGRTPSQCKAIYHKFRKSLANRCEQKTDSAAQPLTSSQTGKLLLLRLSEFHQFRVQAHAFAVHYDRQEFAYVHGNDPFMMQFANHLRALADANTAFVQKMLATLKNQATAAECPDHAALARYGDYCAMLLRVLQCIRGKELDDLHFYSQDSLDTCQSIVTQVQCAKKSGSAQDARDVRAYLSFCQTMDNRCDFKNCYSIVRKVLGDEYGSPRPPLPKGDGATQ